MKKVLLFCCILALASCVSNRTNMSLIVPEGVNFTANDLNHSRVIRSAKGEDTSGILLFIPLGHPNFAAAVNKTIQNGKGDALINAKIDESVQWYVLFGIQKISITADVINLPKR